MITFKEYLESLRHASLRGDDWDVDVDWGVIANHLRENTCDERRRTDTCPHDKCEEGAELARIAEDANLGDREPSKHEIDQMIRFIHSKTCNIHRGGGQCSHRGCGYTVHLISWLREKEGLAAA